MKKGDFILIGIIVLIGVIAILSTKGTHNVDIEYPVKLYGEAGLHEIDYNKYNELVSTNEPFIFIIERKGCGYCQMYMPIVEEVANEKKIAIYYIDTEAVPAEDIQKLSKENKYLKRNTDWGTPTTLFMKGEDILGNIGGYVEKDSFLAFLDGKVEYGE